MHLHIHTHTHTHTHTRTHTLCNYRAKQLHVEMLAYVYTA